jgi:hypothetical protein
MSAPCRPQAKISSYAEIGVVRVERATIEDGTQVLRMTVVYADAF